MDQFGICRLKQGRAGSASALVVVLQRAILEDVRTRVVAPLLPYGQVMPTAKLHPRIEIDGVDYVVVTERLAAVDRSTLIETSHRADHIRDEIVRAVDFLFTG